jgi:para-nitrobenzyl esterase
LQKLIIAFAVFAAAAARSQIETATVTGGEVRGVVKYGVASFKGLPFAAPPVGELRWKAPQPVVPWQGTRNADAFGPGPMQNPDLATLMGNFGPLSEDCLYLNVWTAARNTQERRPVMVWIYGGAFMSGTTSQPIYDGTRLAKKGVVLVSLAYRVGPFGFLAHPELSQESGHGSGCYGLQDQVAALRWVKENIAHFGGDPDRVTIFGESAGGISVSMLTVVPAARGLFQRAISESGGSLAPIKTASEAGENVRALALAEKTGAEFLRQLGANDLKAARALSATNIQQAVKGFGTFWPTLDGVTLPGDAYALFEARRFNDTPILVGFNSDEGAMFVRSGMAPAGFEKYIRANFGPAAEAILKAYPHATDAETFKSAKDIFRETEFAWPTWAWATLEHRRGTNNAFVYYFDHRNGFSPDGATHAAELGFVFHNQPGFFGAPSAGDVALSDLMNAYWINFAASGNPNAPGLPPWPAFDDQEMVETFTGPSSAATPMPNREKILAIDAYYAWRREQARTAGK